MKRLFQVALMVTMFVTSAFANNTDKVNQKLNQSLTRDFANAKDVKWEQSKEFSKATFTLNGQVLFAFYNAEGELMATTRNIVSGQLPINLQTELKKEYGTMWITDLFEMAANNVTTYYVTLECADYTIVLKSDDASSWSVYKKDRKFAE